MISLLIISFITPTTIELNLIGNRGHITNNSLTKNLKYFAIRLMKMISILCRIEFRLNVMVLNIQDFNL